MFILRGEEAGRKTFRAGLFDAIDEDDAFFIVDFLKTDLDDFGIAGLDGAANVLRFDGHFAVAAIDQDAERNALRTTEIKESIHGGADGASGIKNVIDEDEVHAVYAERDMGGLQNGLRGDLGQIIAIEGDVEGADGNIDAINATHGPCNALREGHAAATDSDEGEISSASAFFDNLVSKALQRAVNLRSRHELSFFDDLHDGVNANTKREKEKVRAAQRIVEREC